MNTAEVLRYPSHRAGRTEVEQRARTIRCCARCRAGGTWRRWNRICSGSRRGCQVKSPDELRRENETLRDRISRLSAAVLRVSASLDLNTVLHEIVESARALTGARVGALTTVDDSGAAPELHHRRLRAGRAPPGRGLARRAAALRTPPGPAGRAESAGPARLRPIARLVLGGDAVDDLPGNADAASGRGCRPLLSRRQGRRPGVHQR